MGVYKPLQVLIMGGDGLLWVADLPNLVMQAVPPVCGLLLVAVWPFMAEVVPLVPLEILETTSWWGCPPALDCTLHTHMPWGVLFHMPPCLARLQALLHCKLSMPSWLRGVFLNPKP